MKQLWVIIIVSFQYCDRGGKQTTATFKWINETKLGRCGEETRYIGGQWWSLQSYL